MPKQTLKRHVCKYCHQHLTKLPRHLRRKHHAERDVANALSLPDDQQAAALFAIVKEGTSLHNFTVLRTNPEQIIPRRVSSTANAKRLPCPQCKDFFVGANIAAHKCQAPPSIQQAREYRLERSQIGPELKAVLANMRIDDVYNRFLRDDLVLAFGNSISEDHVGNKHQYNMISSRLRELGRLLQQLNEFGITSLREVLTSPNYELLKRATFKIGGYDALSRKWQNPSIAKHIGHSINRCAEEEELKVIFAEGDPSIIRNFQFVMKKKWHRDIVRKCLETLDCNKRNNKLAKSNM